MVLRVKPTPTRFPASNTPKCVSPVGRTVLLANLHHLPTVTVCPDISLVVCKCFIGHLPSLKRSYMCGAMVTTRSRHLSTSAKLSGDPLLFETVVDCE